MPTKRGGNKSAGNPKSANGTADLGFEAKLWLVAYKLRNNMDAAEYKHVVLGFVFLKYIEHVTVADMKRLLVRWPTKAILAAFDRIVGPIFDRTFSNTLESRTLATLRDTLLPKLLSGEVKLANATERRA